ncbi:general odorant-binding protein 67-like [Anopheles darlingi]|uniref:general odorant-binding protein 67-like n=1 Tax=Anopheles darlingi TaxID=43151 RepID=UPI00210032B5|nr:general odorant-binding protein 67-like [Anopheles darlingi]
MPLLLPPPVVELCMRRPMPPVLPGEVDPLPYNCLAECSLNVTRILMNKQFRVEQARKVLLARVDNDRNWTAIIERAVQNCYKQQILNWFYLQEVAQNKISSQCVPSSSAFMGCVFAIMYRDCPTENWIGLEYCSPMVSTLNNCKYLFKLTTII